MNDKSPFKIDPKRSIFLNSGFTEKDANILIKQLYDLNLKDGPIFLQMNGSGGSFAGAKKLYDNIVISPNPVTGVVAGDAFSALAIVLQACQKRYATKLSRFHLHYVSYPITFNIQHNDNILMLKDTVLKELKLLRSNNEILLKILATRITSISRAKLEKLLNDETDLTPEQALELGLIDKII